MASDLEKEAAKLLERLIQESKDDPPKLATKLYLVCGTQFNFFCIPKFENLIN